jgi:hypothetical protein
MNLWREKSSSLHTPMKYYAVEDKALTRSWWFAMHSRLTRYHHCTDKRINRTMKLMIDFVRIMQSLPFKVEYVCKLFKASMLQAFLEC